MLNVCSVMSGWFSSWAEEGALLPPVCQRRAQRSQVSPGAAGAAGTRWAVPLVVSGEVPMAEGRAAGWVSCSCPVPGLDGGFGICHRGSGLGLCRERGEWCWGELGRCSCCCPCLVTPQVLCAGEGGDSFCCTGPLCLPHPAGLGGLAGLGGPQVAAGAAFTGHRERGKGLDC